MTPKGAQALLEVFPFVALVFELFLLSAILPGKLFPGRKGAVQGSSTPSGRSLKLARILSSILVAVVFCLISLGSLVRNEGAGLACPDWPLCFGHVVPPMSYQVFLEWFHRLVAGTVSIGFLVLSYLVLKTKALRAILLKWIVGGFLLLASQVVLGGMTVLGLLHPGWVSSHLGAGLAFFCVLVWISVKLWDFGSAAGKPNPKSKARFLITTAAVALFLQCILGGGVSSNYAGLACPDFPTCYGKFWPPFEGLVRFQMLHRIGALIVTVLLCLAVAKALRLRISARGRAALLFVPLVLIIQVFLGVGSVLFKLPLPMSVAHLGTAATLLGLVLIARYEVSNANN